MLPPQRLGMVWVNAQVSGRNLSSLPMPKIHIPSPFALFFITDLQISSKPHADVGG